jgi:hypothetical protein
MRRFKTALRTALAVRAGANAAIACALLALVTQDCSSSSGGPESTSDYSTPIGVGVGSTCEPTTCPPPGLCGGALLTAAKPVTYCTVPCTKDSDCPQGAGCETKATYGHCLKKCTADAQCSGGFTCVSSAASGLSGTFCWSPYNGKDPDAGSD